MSMAIIGSSMRCRGCAIRFNPIVIALKRGVRKMSAGKTMLETIRLTLPVTFPPTEEHDERIPRKSGVNRYG
jgi:hypothetical protein